MVGVFSLVQLGDVNSKDAINCQQVSSWQLVAQDPAVTTGGRSLVDGNNEGAARVVIYSTCKLQVVLLSQYVFYAYKPIDISQQYSWSGFPLVQLDVYWMTQTAGNLDVPEPMAESEAAERLFEREHPMGMKVTLVAISVING